MTEKHSSEVFSSGKKVKVHSRFTFLGEAESYLVQLPAVVFEVGLVRRASFLPGNLSSGGQVRNLTPSVPV